MKAIELLEYILFRLPIYDLTQDGFLSLEDIYKKFKLTEPSDEPTQEELAENLLQNINREEKMEKTNKEERILIEHLVKHIDKDMADESYRKYASRELEV